MISPEATLPAAAQRRGAVGAPGRRGSPLRRAQYTAAYALMAPALALFTVAFVIPIGYSVWLSVFGRRSGSGGAYAAREEQFVGLGNYLDVLADPTFWESLLRLAVFSVLLVPLMMVTSILLALLLDLPRARLGAFSRTAIFLPYGVPSVIAALMWGFLYVPEISPVHQLASGVGVELPALLTGDWIYVALVNVVLWGGIGFNTVIIYTSLQSLPREQIDAARIDGCGEARIARYVKLPHVVPATVLTGLFAMIGALQIYSEPTMLATLANGIHSTFFPLMRVYRDAYAHDDLNTAAAGSILLALATVVLSLLVLGGRQLAARRAER
ncbi:carbohydrate ABC transporter permease [Pseudonocardia sichuanensis]|uniref:Carbohydrate ABC transporter membrane protein 1 (CUT1 family) n=1 Tax=Pseudonocardia kunmingensis TaxID=630975 RepID=A0A543D0H4_9PSEU|nr:sugar ABC transporter permease [Pseudonocardia kunmingensis]TQM02855.1 carbohydrate ABC transporter membrane protein 1 (CUT1 family) [Pseudonocardia kunmingensis]